jgi:Protein of unknown function (DUF2950)
MKSTHANNSFSGFAWVAGVLTWACLCVPVHLIAQQTPTKQPPASATTRFAGAMGFDTTEQAVDALVSAADPYNKEKLAEIFGHNLDDIILVSEPAQEQQRAADFSAQAHEKKSVAVDPKNGNRAFLLVGNEEWPFPVPLVKSGGKWYFDSKAGRQELLYRRIGSNELDAIQICNGYVEAQENYSLEPRKGYQVNQYAQRIISTPGTQDGLAWQNPDGTWGGPIGENIAKAIAQGYTSREDSYHGYFFKVLKGQGPDAPLGQLNYVIEGAMIGGFALVAAPADYRVTGVKTFIVSNDGVVYQKDFGPNTLDEFKKMEIFNPDKSWTPIPEEDN